MYLRSVSYCLLPVLLILQSCAMENRPVFEHGVAGNTTPWTHESFDVEDDRFMFAIFSDLYGGERAGVFAVAMEQIRMLHPELVLNVGDLIDGGTEDLATLIQEWNEFDAKLASLRAPTFYIGGNHDLSNPVMREFWEDRYGARYYHFVYKNVLFLMLDSEDMDEGRMQQVFEARAVALEVRRNDPDKSSETEYFAMKERTTGAVSTEQGAYFREVIEKYPNVRWTFLLMHKPVWRNDDAAEFQSIEAALADRPYTVINGHFHAYSLTERNGRDYIHLGTTSGSQNPNDPMSFDHVTLVTMTADGPSLVNLRLEGILDKAGQIPLNGDALCFQASRCQDPPAE